MRRKLAMALLALTITATAQVKTDKEVDLDEVVVTGTGTEHLLKNAPVQTEVISGKQLRNYGARSISASTASGYTATTAARTTSG